MAGMYGTIKPADIDITNDVEIFYHYRPSLNSDDTNFANFKTLDASCLVPCSAATESSPVSISGLFNLKLPLEKFGKKGIYTIYIRPREISAVIDDIGVLAAYPDVRGVVFKVNTLNGFETNNSLVGYRIEYLNDEGNKNQDFKIITSSNRAEAMSYMLNSASDKGTKYRFTMSGNLVFCTVTPSLASTFKPNDMPLIGYAGQEVKLVNTKFNPVMIELEMVEHDDETITYMLEGNQLVDKDRALISTFNPNGEIYHQAEYGTYKNDYGNPLYEFKKVRENIDFNQNLENLE